MCYITQGLPSNNLKGDQGGGPGVRDRGIWEDDSRRPNCISAIFQTNDSVCSPDPPQFFGPKFMSGGRW